MSHIVVIDYQSGNLRSVAKALEHVAPSAKVEITNNPQAVLNASHIVLPGVGAFGDCAAGLKAIAGMADAFNEAVHQQQKPFLGICVGMQLLAAVGHEHGTTRGLGWLPAEVVRLPNQDGLKIPHIGWNSLHGLQPHPVLAGIHEGDHAYFVHSYYMQAKPEHVLATCLHGIDFPAVVAQGSFLGVQFHPEKSQAVGLRLLKNFVAWGSGETFKHHTTPTAAKPLPTAVER